MACTLTATGRCADSHPELCTPLPISLVVARKEESEPRITEPNKFVKHRVKTRQVDVVHSGVG
jgi:hypothetical protein